MKNTTRTWNGDLAFKSTKNKNLDLFLSDLRSFDNNDVKLKEQIIELFTKAFHENKQLALLNFFNIMDVRNGKGEKFATNVIVQFLNSIDDEFLIKHLKVIVELSRWDRLFQNFSVLNARVQKAIIDLIKNNKEDLLMYKWLPSENASNEKTKLNAKLIRKALGISSKQYRQLLTENRKKLNIIEANLSQKTYDKINVEVIPKLASIKYSKALWKYKEPEMSKFVDKLTSGEIKSDVSVLTPVDIYKFYLNTDESARALAYWRDQKDFIHTSIFPVIDVSGSMGGFPSLVANSLGVYIAERNKGAFKNKVMLFSDDSKVLDLSKAANFIEKINLITKYSDVASTNLDSVYEKLIEMGKNDVKSIPSKILLISDTQFNPEDTFGCGTFAYDKTATQRWISKFAALNIPMPQVIYWNVNAPLGKVPFEAATKDVAMISGYSIHILNSLTKLDVKNVENLCVEIMNTELEKYKKYL